MNLLHPRFQAFPILVNDQRLVSVGLDIHDTTVISVHDIVMIRARVELYFI